ncbi:uncharacterized protein EAE98_011032 [Botrytis deweyae]|uniref:UBC core domain-containing protein n=1 Tax=Botrytis deweyae TaxID=2478750 RepID=A0ABQ7I733_9HELO|nr:uncharacterized protein EAE98_011032 [Botrytis deweyae]KAF7915689.1 hypothetical protein EAE98_011032 [Botrytis deweyae]
MSGAAEGLAGLALSAISVAALFTTCIECFDIVIAGKNFSEDFEQLCALFSLERARFGLWGESVGLIPEPNTGIRLKYDENIDRPDIRPGVERILNNIKSLLEEGAKINKKHQKDTSAWKVTSWAVHDARKFESLIERLKRYVDGLESITVSLGLLKDQHSRLRQEIDIISDVESLRLLRDATSSHKDSASLVVSDTASSRMFTLEGNGYTTRGITKSSFTYGSSLSFKTALSKPSQDIDSLVSAAPQPPGAWPRLLQFPKNTTKRALLKSARTCEQCFHDEKKCVTNNEVLQCYSCVQTGKNCSLSRPSAKISPTTSAPVSHETASLDNDFTNESSTDQVSQNRRLMQGIIAVTGYRQHLSFSDGDKHNGDRLTATKNQDLEYWVHNSGKLVSNADTGTAALKRVFLELRDIRQANVPFMSAIPVNDCLNTILASIEGPPETPFEGGIFWITIRITDRYPRQLPLMRFNTKIHHPNISPQGYVCYADGQLQKYSKLLNKNDKWFLGSDRKLNWSLGALLTALCGLLSSPDVDNPLVPEIAHTYLDNYDEYCCNARLYTKMYAIGERPDESHLLFPDDSSEETDVMDSFHDDYEEEKPGSDLQSLQSLQTSLREVYDTNINLTDLS